MNWIVAIIDSIVDFVRRNPLTCMALVMIAVFLPSAFGALLVGLVIVVLLVLAIPIIALFRLRRISRQMEEQAREQGFGGGYSYQRRRQSHSAEGDVRVYTTDEAAEKRVSDDVGEYVDFEEVKEKK
jgi:hypothetical protein